MISNMFHTRLVRPVILYLCATMTLGAPLSALGDSVRITPDAEAFGQAEVWVDPATYSGARSVTESWIDDLGRRLNPWIASPPQDLVDPLAMARHVAVTQGPGSTDPGQADHQPTADSDTGLSQEQLRRLTLTDAVGLDTDAFIRAYPLPNPPGLKAGESRFRPPQELIHSMTGKADLDRAPLIPGLNLLSIPEEPADAAPAAVLAPIAGSFTRVYAYENCDPADKWKIYDPNDVANSDLTVLDHTKGFWLEAISAVDLPFDGTLPATTTFQICPGWNLIGYPAGQSRHVTNALHSIEGKYLRVFGYDAADPNDPWEVYSVGVPDWGNDLDLMHPGRGYWVLATDSATLEIANEGPDPVVEITAPQDLSVVTDFTEVLGTVQSPILESWRLTYQLIGEGEPVEIASGVAPVMAGNLGTFDPTLLINGLYELKLEATDLDGRAVEDSIAVTVEGKLKIGHFALSFVDLEISLAGLDIDVIRNYDSRQKDQQGDFGFGWSLAMRNGSYKNNRAPGDGWQILNPGGPLGLPCSSVVETKSHLTTVRLSDQEIYRFRLRLTDTAILLGGCQARAYFEFVGGPRPGATLEILDGDLAIWENESDRLIDQDTFRVFEPDNVKLTTRDGRIFHFNLENGATYLEDQNGNSIDIRPDGLFHSSELSVELVRDSEGRIVEIIDPESHSMTYAYGLTGDLVSFTDREGHTSTYTYNSEHHFQELFDPRGKKPLRNEFGDDGRIVRHIDAAGREITYNHRLADNHEIVTNRLGQSRLLEYDDRGNVIRVVDETGAETVRTFDGRDNLLTETNALGETTTFTYTEANDIATATDALGNKTSYTYDDRGRVLTVTDPRNFTTTHTYDSEGKLVSVKNPLGHEQTYTYDGAGNILTFTDFDGGITTNTYDSRGNLTRRVDPLAVERTFTYDQMGNRLTESLDRTRADGSTETLVWSFTYDALGRLVTATDPTGATSRYRYDEAGQVIEETDALGRVIRSTFDDLGHQVRIDYPDGTHELRGYDAGGRLTSTTHRGGRVVAFTYDPLGRPLSTRLPGDLVSTRSYDVVGRPSAATDERGNTTRFENDAAGRRIKVTQPLGQEIHSAYDAAGNQIRSVDPRGHATRFEYDAAGRQSRAIFADDTEWVFTYDAAGRRTSYTDQAGRTTSYVYDVRGQLLSVTDDLGRTTTYGYDELGHRVAQTDANGHTTRFEYDAVGRPTARVLPDGSREVMTYDLVGNLKTRTDFQGRVTSYSYDNADRLTAIHRPDGSVVSYTYSHSGRRLTMTDSRGTTHYRYNALEELAEVEHPEGHRLTYAYDAAGNRTALTAHIGSQALTTAYTYDASNRLETVTDPGGRVYTTTYDVASNRTSVSYPNGVETSYDYDSQNRLTRLGSANGAGDLFQLYDYDLLADGRRGAVTELDGTVRNYIYDDGLQLTSESISDSGGVISESSYTYDSVGNRLSRATTGIGAETIAYTYDSRDRLTSESGQAYSWDANGNLLSKAGEADYGWNTWDRLESVTLADGTSVRHTYDASGERIRTETTPAGGQTVGVQYLVDTSGPLSRVIAEIADNGEVQAYNVWGGDLLAIIRSSETRYVHADGLGSVRALTDDTGAVTDRWAYSAFGSTVDSLGTDPQPFRFTGESEEAESGLYYHRARWMDPRVGRFLSMDPFAGDTLNPVTLHRYLYTGADPVNRVDPNGQFFVSVSIASLMVIGLLAAMPVAAQTRALGRKVDLTMTATKVGTAITFPYPEDNGKLYEVPTYELLVEGTDGAGTKRREKYEVVRFGIFNEAGFTTPKVVGLFEAQSHTLRWYGQYVLHSNSSAGNGAWIIKGNHLIHDGSDAPTGTSDLVASIGCIEVCHTGKWTEFNELIRELSGIGLSDPLEQALNRISALRLVKLKIEAASHPPLKEY